MYVVSKSAIFVNFLMDSFFNFRNTSISSRSRSFFSVRRKPSNFIVNSEDPSIAMATKL